MMVSYSGVKEIYSISKKATDKGDSVGGLVFSQNYS